MGSKLALKLVLICSAIFLVSKVESRAVTTEEPETLVGLPQPMFSDYDGSQGDEGKSGDSEDELEKGISNLNLTDLFEGDMLGFTPEYTKLYSGEGMLFRDKFKKYKIMTRNIFPNSYLWSDLLSKCNRLQSNERRESYVLGRRPEHV